MAFKLAIAAVLVVAVAFTMNDEGKSKEFKFKLHFDRLPPDEWDRRIKDDKGNVDNALLKQTLIEITRGWDGQTLVLDDDTGQPAPFSPEARAVMYESVPGFSDIALAAYINGVSARVKT
jgi:hypothetical protein